MQPKQIFTAYDRFDVNQERHAFSYCPICATPLSTTASSEYPRQSCPDCGWIHYRNPAPGVVILITDEVRVLIGKRGASSFASGLWCLPGGFVEFEEDYLGAAIRETREETGLEVEICSVVSVCSNFLASNLHTLVTVLKARVVGGIAQPGDDLEELRWVPLDGPFPDMAFEADSHIIERYRQTRLLGAPVDPEYARLQSGDGR
ncbi:MAG: NUDIX hydrolase [Desulfuromonadales bacterium]|nr:NUDIX hydrolase [Desulfuromonadales bacterium]